MISRRAHLLIFAIGFALVFSRRPDAVIQAQFYAEDGKVWFADAYNIGWLSALFLPWAGYLQVLPRLAAALALLVPLAFAPLAMNLCGILLQLIPANFLLTERCSPWGSLRLRGALAFAYLALPNTLELHASVTEAQWHFAVLFCLVALAPEPKTIFWRVFDCLALIVGGLTGPFCIVLLPLIFAFWVVRRSNRLKIIMAILAAAATLQAFFIFRNAAAARAGTPLGASFDALVRIVADKVYLGVVLGQNALAAHGGTLTWATVALLGTALVVCCLKPAPLELKLFTCFCALTFAACLRSPFLSKSITGPQWRALILADGLHYWFLPMLAFVWILVWFAAYGTWKPALFAVRLVLLCSCFGVVKDWRYPAFPDLHFREQATHFESAPPGSAETFALEPPGWEMRLVKKP